MESKKNRIVISLLRLGSFLVRTGNRLVVEHGLNQQQFVVLKEIQALEPVSAQEVCSKLLHEKSNLSKIVNKLVEIGLVEKSDDPSDGRSSLLHVSEKGREVIKTCMDLFESWNTEWLAKLSDQELDHTVNVLDKLKKS